MCIAEHWSSVSHLAERFPSAYVYLLFEMYVFKLRYTPVVISGFISLLSLPLSLSFLSSLVPSPL